MPALSLRDSSPLSRFPTPSRQAIVDRLQCADHLPRNHVSALNFAISNHHEDPTRRRVSLASFFNKSRHGEMKAQKDEGRTSASRSMSTATVQPPSTVHPAGNLSITSDPLCPDPRSSASPRVRLLTCAEGPPVLPGTLKSMDSSLRHPAGKEPLKWWALRSTSVRELPSTSPPLSHCSPPLLPPPA